MSVVIYDQAGSEVRPGLVSRFFARFGWGRIGGLTHYRGAQRTGPNHSSTPAVPVTFDSAMTVSAFWACVQLLASTIASLPPSIYSVRNGARVTEDRHPLYPILLYRPNAYQTRVEFWETVVLQLAVHSNAYCRIVRARDGRIQQLIPLMSEQVEPQILDDGTLVYVHTRDSLRGVDVTVYAAESIWHLKEPGNGIMGLSRIDHMRDTIALADGAQRAMTKIFRNGAKPAGVLTIDKPLRAEQRAQIKNAYADLTEGNEDDTMLVLENGYTFKQISLTPQDIELLASRKYSVEDICRFFGIPSILVNATESSTGWGSGIEQIIAGWYKLGLRPYLTRIEVSAERHLLSAADQTRYQIEFDLDVLLRSDRGERIEQGRVAVGAGLETVNEWRAREGMPPVDGGDKPLVNGTMVTIDTATVAKRPAKTDGEGKPLAPADDVQQQALNGAQVTALQSLLQSVASGLIPLETARAMIAGSFPLLTDAEISAMVNPLRTFTPPAAPPAGGGARGPATQNPPA